MVTAADVNSMVCRRDRPGRPGRDDEVRPVRAEEYGRAEHVLVRGQGVRATAGARGRLGEDGPAGGFGHFPQRFGVLGSVAADDQPALGPRNFERRRRPRPAERGPRRSAGAAIQPFRPPARLAAGRTVSRCPLPAARPRVPGRRPAAARPRIPGRRPVRDERVTERQVQVHRPGRAARGAGRRPPGPAGQRPPVGRLPGAFLRRADLAEPAHRVAVQLDLVDGLVGAGAAQFRRAVRGQHQQRNARLAGLDHRGVEAGRRRPGRADHAHRPAARLGQAQRQVRRRALVDTDVQPHIPALRPGEQLHRQRRAPGTRREHRIGHPAADQLVGQGDGQRRRRVHHAAPRPQ